MAEKILARASGLRKVSPGDIVEAEADLVMVHDITGPLAIKVIKEIGAKRIWDPKRLVVVLDHQVPADTIESANLHAMVRDFVREQGIMWFYDVGQGGIAHQILVEDHVMPGQLVVGADSHTCTSGALGAFATGVGSTDVAAAMLTGKLWFKVPESMKIVVHGELKPLVTPKDLILNIVGDVGADGATYMAIEFTGSTIRDMSLSGRMTLCNMSVEMGAKTGMVPPDEATLRYLAGAGRPVSSDVRSIIPDPDASYSGTREYDASEVEPSVAIPPRVDHVKPVREVEGIEVDQVFIGSCTNGRIEDLELVARLLRGKQIARRVRCIVIPASRRIYLEALKKGIIEDLMRAGCAVYSPTCGPCLGGHMGVLGEEEVAVSTSNRNFIGRMGAKTSRVFLVSPATAAAAALTGKLVDPRDVVGS